MKLPRISRDSVAAVGTAVGQGLISALVAHHVITAAEGLSYTGTVVSFFVGYRLRNGQQVAAELAAAAQDVVDEPRVAAPSVVRRLVDVVAPVVEGAPVLPAVVEHTVEAVAGAPAVP